MDLKIFKQSIENKQVTIPFLIFQYVDNDFLPKQYLNAIKNILNVDIDYIEDINTIINLNNDIFGLSDSDNNLKVYVTDTFDNDNLNLLKENNTVVITKKLSDESKDTFKDNILIFPKLEDWQVKDYVYSLANGIAENKLDHLIEICKNDIYRLDKELSKLKLFTEQERKYVYDKFVDEGIFEDLSNHNIFDFTNAIIRKDIPSLISLYKEIEKIDVEPLGLVTTLYNNFRNIISIQLNPSATAEALGMPSNRFWAIKKYSCGFYNREQLLRSFYLITDIDRRLKIGEITTDIMIDYIVCHVLSF